MKVKEHYDIHLADFYSWMIGDFEIGKDFFKDFCVKHEIKPNKTGLAIDLGAGNGIQSIALGELGFELKAVDFNDKLLSELRDKIKGLPIELIKDDIRNIKSFTNSSVDLIVCCGDTKLIRILLYSISGKPAKAKSEHYFNRIINFVVMNRQELTYKVKESIRSIDPDARVILFGSKARGDSNKSSDWDFLVLTSRQADDYLKRQIRERVLDTELEAEEVISTIIFSKETWRDYQITPLYKNISKDGVEL